MDDRSDIDKEQAMPISRGAALAHGCCGAFRPPPRSARVVPFPGASPATGETPPGEDPAGHPQPDAPLRKTPA